MAQATKDYQLSKEKEMKSQSDIYFAGGCFWGTEHFMKQINGVTSTQAGYANGKESIKNPSYEQVCNDNTGFAETVKVSYNPQEADLKLLIELLQNHRSDKPEPARKRPGITIPYRHLLYG